MDEIPIVEMPGGPRPLDDCVHAHYGRWFVGHYDAEANQWQAPVRKDLRALVGSPIVFAPDRATIQRYAYSYARRSDAARRARQLYWIAGEA